MKNEHNIIGQTVEEATSYARRNGYELRVVQQGNSPYIASQGIGERVLNVAAKDGIVTEVK